VKEKRDRAVLSTLLFHVLRREERCKLYCIELTTRSPATRQSRLGEEELYRVRSSVSEKGLLERFN
jgi:hypothetical protein